MISKPWAMLFTLLVAVMVCALPASSQPPVAGAPGQFPGAPGVQGPVQFDPFASPGLGFDPYAAQQPGGSGLSDAFPQFAVEPALPVFPASFPVRLVVSGEFLYLRASDAAMTNFAVPVNGAVLPPPTPAVPFGPVASVELDFEPGFRVGLDWVWNDYSRWVATYTSLDLKSADQISVDPAALPLVLLQSLVMHPSTPAADAFYLNAGANGELKLRLGDAEYRRVFVEDWYRWDFLVGMRYASLDQSFKSAFTNVDFIETVNSSVDFEGGGIRFGTRGDWRSANHGCFIYAQATTSFVAGRFSSRYDQTNSVLGTIVSTSRKDDRIINITDAELGAGWRSPGRRWLFSGGYLFNIWDDVISNAGLIRAVQATSFGPIRDRLTFDGLAARAELRF